jgi:hypothetical protein
MLRSLLSLLEWLTTTYETSVVISHTFTPHDEVQERYRRHGLHPHVSLGQKELADMVSLNEITVWRLHMPLLKEDYQEKLCTESRFAEFFDQGMVLLHMDLALGP